MRKIILGLIAAIGVTSASAALAVPVVQNGEFDAANPFRNNNAGKTSVVVNEGNQPRRLDGWDIETRGLLINPNPVVSQNSAGSPNVAPLLPSFDGTVSFGLRRDNHISQTIGGMEAGETYRLVFAWYGANININREQVAVTLDGVDGENGSEAVEKTFALKTGRNREAATLGWKIETIEFTAVSDEVTLKFQSLLRGEELMALDSVRVTGVPLPAPAFLLVGALAGLGALRLRRRAA